MQKKSVKIISTTWVVLVAFICVTFLGIFADSLLFKKDGNSAQTDVKETLSGKYISFIGDSITTYQGWNNNTTYNSTIGSNAIWYSTNKLSNVNSTWWKKSIDNLDLKLCVNNSWSGSQVTITQGESASACMTRSQNLHNDKKNITPDIIVVYIGINDYNRGITLGSFDGISDIYDYSTKQYIGNLSEFADAYATMVHKITRAYPNADIYLCTLDQYNDTGIPSWNKVIKQIAEAFDCNIVDFYNDTPMNTSNKSSYTIDGLHPNASGMNEMYKVLKKSLEKNYD